MKDKLSELLTLNLKKQLLQKNDAYKTNMSILKRMEITRLGPLATEIFKTRENINPSNMKNIFTLKTNAKIRPHGIIVRYPNTATYGDKSLTALGPKIWNKIPTNIQSLTSITKSREYIRTWFGPNSKCGVSRTVK